MGGLACCVSSLALAAGSKRLKPSGRLPVSSEVPSRPSTALHQHELATWRLTCAVNSHSSIYSSSMHYMNATQQRRRSQACRRTALRQPRLRRACRGAEQLQAVAAVGEQPSHGSHSGLGELARGHTKAGRKTRYRGLSKGQFWFPSARPQPSTRTNTHACVQHPCTHAPCATSGCS